MSLFDLVAETALKKLKKHMQEKKISAYLAKIDDKGEMTTTPLEDGYVILTASEHETMKQLIKKSIHI